MRGMTLLIATILTLGYGFAAQAAMSLSIHRAGTAPEAVSTGTSRIWYGGTLAPVTVEASAEPKCAAAAAAKLDNSGPRTNL
jgi:hypothetical protein